MSAGVGYRATLLHEPEAMAGLEEEWNALLAASDVDMPFLTHEWLTLWWRHFGRGKPATLVVRYGGSLVFALPLAEARGAPGGPWLRVLRSTTNFHSYRFAPIAHREHPEAAGAAWRHLRARGGWDLIELQDLPLDPGEECALAREAARDGCPIGIWPAYASPYVETRGSWHDYEATLAPKFRANLRNRERRLAREGEVCEQLVATEGDVERALPRALEVERLGWKGASGSAIASSPVLRSFYAEWARIAARRGWLRLFLLEAGDRLVAFELNLEYGRTLYCMKIGYDPAFAPYGPGQVLKARVLGRCFRQGLRRYDFLGAESAAKRVWNPKLARHVWLFLYNAGARARAGHAVKFRLAPALRKALR